MWGIVCNASQTTIAAKQPNIFHGRSSRDCYFTAYQRQGNAVSTPIELARTTPVPGTDHEATPLTPYERVQNVLSRASSRERPSGMTKTLQREEDTRRRRT